MRTIIISADRAKPGQVDTLLKNLAGVSDSEQIVIGHSKPASEVPATFLLIDGDNVHEALTRAVQKASGSEILLTIAGADTTTEAASELLMLVASSQEIAYARTEVDGDLQQIDELSPAALITYITSENLALTTTIAFRRNALPTLPEGNSGAEITSKFIIAGMQSSGGIAPSHFTVSAAIDQIGLTPMARASILKMLIDHTNIEEIFPTMPWQSHERESAACAYHTLAAHFIRLLDIDSAFECLKLSDSLEDSPRSLALKGIISLRRGELLGAVANMVSSLQQYEIRKKENEAHFAQFSPEDVAAIAGSLKDGLHALNHRDNARAVNHFTEAVFKFDPFYNELGLGRVASRAH